MKFDYEFGGPIGALCTTIFLPIVTLLLTYWASLGYVGFEQSLSTCTSDYDNDASISSMLYKPNDIAAFLASVRCISQ